MTMILWTAAGIGLAVAVVHLALWSGNRRELAPLFFGIMCLGLAGTFYSDGICYTAKTVAQYERGLAWLFTFAFPTWSAYAWFCRAYGRTRSMLFPIVFSLIFAALWVVNLGVHPSVFVSVTGIEQGLAPWGTPYAIPVRTVLWGLIVHVLTVSAVLVWSLWLAVRLLANGAWREGVALGTGASAAFAGLCFDIVRDSLSINWLYMTEFGAALMVLIMGVGLALEHRARKRELEVATARQRAIFAAAKHVAFIVARQEQGSSIVREFSPGAERLFDCSSRDAEGRPITDFIPTAVTQEFQPDAEQSFRDTGAFAVETTLYRQTGGSFPALLSLHALRDAAGATVGGLAVAIDISERKRSEAAIVRSEADLRRAQQLAHVGSWRFDVAQAVLLCSDELLRIHGRNPGEPVSNDSLLADVHAEDRQRVEALVQGVQPGAQAMIDYRIVVAGRERWLRGLVEGVFDADGQLTEMIGTVEDITERVKLEGQLLQARKMEAVGQLAGGIAHDFNNILQAIMGSVDLALVEPDAGPATLALLDDTMAAAERAAEMVGQLLAFSRRQVLQPQDLDPNAVVAGLVKLLRRLLGASIQIKVVPGDKVGLVHADRGQLDQVLMNLFVNARDAMPAGGVLTVETGAVTFDEAFCAGNPWAKPGDFVLLSVSDTGVGMDATTLAHLFEPFFTTKAVGKGTGLGLATVHGVVSQHGGMVQVYSEVGKGSTFRVYLPRTNRVVEPVRAPERRASSGGCETILVADDFDIVRSLICTVLTRAGYKVLVAVDGAEALRLAEEHGASLSLAILDVVMPGSGGIQLRDQLQARFPKLRFLIMSGFTAEGMPAGFKPGLDEHFLQKPFLAEDLRNKVRTLLDA